ncbi:MAG: hypothetical protein H7296_01395, partial [Bacteroidia bacterium]|nr:hypothetical protein [Bacteroidia bacterium]
MRKIRWSVLFLILQLGFATVNAFAQTKNRIILTGKFENFTGNSLDLYLTNISLGDVNHKIPVINGEFTIPDSLITTAQTGILAFKNTNDYLLISVLLAPKYRISLKADALNTIRFYETFVWSGHGSLINNFYSEMNKNLWDFDESGKTDFDIWFKVTRKTTDSLYHKYSNTYKDVHDPNFSYFQKIIFYDIQFHRLNNLMRRACIMLDHKTPEEVNDYIKANYDQSILKNISDKQFLASADYRRLMSASFWHLFYLVKYDDKVHPDVSRTKYQIYLDKILQVYKDEVRDYVLYKFIHLNLVEAVSSYEEFRERAALTMPILNSFKNKAYNNKLIRSIQNKESKLVRV